MNKLFIMIIEIATAHGKAETVKAQVCNFNKIRDIKRKIYYKHDQKQK